MNHYKFFIKTDILKNFAKFTGKHPCQSLFFNKMAPPQVFSCEFSEIFKNTLFTEHLRATACDYIFIEKKHQHFEQKL